MQLTIDKYTHMVAPLEVRDLDLALRASMTGELGNNRSKRLDIVGAHDHVAEAPSFSAA
jgi:hypothetical protein